MNSYENKRLKRTQNSWKNWRKKATGRNQELRKLKQKTKDLTHSRDQWRQKHELLQQTHQALMATIQAGQKTHAINPQPFYFIMVSLCLNLNIHCSISFRSIPKILSVFSKTFQQLGLSLPWRIPHFTSVVHWVLRLGKHLLAQQLVPMAQRWIAVMDHSIQVGTKKVFVILKVPVTSLRGEGALSLSEVQVLFLKVQEHWNGDAVEACLKKVFHQTGFPSQVVMDGGSDLNKGVRQTSESMKNPLKITYDLTHFIAKLLKKKYQQHPTFCQIMSNLAQTKNKLQQTAYSFLMPPKERAKSRFLNLPAMTQWTVQIRSYLQSSRSDDPLTGPQKEELHEHLAWVFQESSFLDELSTEMQILSRFQKELKNVALTEETYKNACDCLHGLKDSNLKEPLKQYLDTEFQFARHQPHRILLTSDIIESLFGKYKYLVKPHSFSEINRMVLTLPTICQEITPDLIQNAFENTKQRELLQWIKEEIGSTLRAKRKKALSKKLIHKTDAEKIIPFPVKRNRSIPVISLGQETVGTKQALG